MSRSAQKKIFSIQKGISKIKMVYFLGSKENDFDSIMEKVVKLCYQVVHLDSTIKYNKVNHLNLQLISCQNELLKFISRFQRLRLKKRHQSKFERKFALQITKPRM